jgi:hypothetical protein
MKTQTKSTGEPDKRKYTKRRKTLLTDKEAVVEQARLATAASRAATSTNPHSSASESLGVTSREVSSPAMDMSGSPDAVEAILDTEALGEGSSPDGSKLDMVSGHQLA